MAELTDNLAQLHLLRPWWLIAIPVALLLLWWLKHRKKQLGSWAKVIDPRWLPFLLERDSEVHRGRTGLWLLAFAVAALGLAGPTWKQLPQPVHKSLDALVIVLDLSPSMLVPDLKPDRIRRARYKLQDILDNRKQGLTALIVYGGYAHTVTPLTDDTANIASQLEVLHPDVIASPGSNTEVAIEQARQLLADGGYTGGDILLITDGVASDAAENIRQQLRGSGIRLSILGIGTASGAPIPLSGGGFAKDSKGNIVVARLERESLMELASLTNGLYSDLTPDNRDLTHLTAGFGAPLEQQTKQLERTFDSWDDQGHWLALLLLPLVVLAFRKGLLACLLLTPLLMPEPAFAAESSFDWKSLWQTRDKQGQQAFDSEDFDQAARVFETPNWKGSAAYRNGDYEAALEEFQRDDSATGFYNQGNALARLDKLDEAIAAYGKALEKDPTFEDAAANKKLLEELKKQQQQNSNQQSDSQQQEKQDSQQQSQQQPSDSDGDQQPSEDKSQQQSDANQGGEQPHSEQKTEQQEEQSEQESEQQAEQQDSDKQSAEKQREQDKKQTTADDSESTEQQAAKTAQQQAEQEAKQAMEQFLRKVPDDPGAFLREKFRRQSLRRQQRNRQQDNHSNSRKRW